MVHSGKGSQEDESDQADSAYVRATGYRGDLRGTREAEISVDGHPEHVHHCMQLRHLLSLVGVDEYLVDTCGGVPREQNAVV